MHVIPTHILPDAHGLVVVTPVLPHDHILYPEIDWILVDAINPHNALSWKEGHTG
jgi:hypothetical protein